MNLQERLSELARIAKAPAPVVSVYLDTRWTDEHQRERVRIFLKNELRRARQSAEPRPAEADLDWIEAQGEALISQARFPEAHGVALFACQALDLRDVLPVRVPFDDAFVVAPAPFLRPLAALADETPTALVVFVDSESARLVPVGPAGAGEEVTLQSEVPGRHSRGAWAQLAQARYQRHVQEHRDRHFEAVVESLLALVDGRGVERIVLAGELRNLAVFRKGLPPRIAERVAGTVAGARHEEARLMVHRATELLAHLTGQEQGEAVDAALTAAAKDEQAVAGLDRTLEAINRGAVHRLYVTKGLNAPGRACRGCGTLDKGPGTTCRLCGGATAVVELSEAMSDRVLASGGRVEVVAIHQDLVRAGGVAALLRYPL
jgi:peptide chain release factor subunit 1